MSLLRLRFGVATLLLALSASALAECDQRATCLKAHPLPADVTPRVHPQSCGVWTGFYGPIDYRKAGRDVRTLVESVHFDEYIARFLAWPVTKPFDQNISSNLGYTLRAFPNHPTALLTMEQIGRRLGREDIPGSYYPLECWYTRALQLVDDDPMVRAQYGIYLANRGRQREAQHNLAIGERGLCFSRVMQYEIGLAYVQIGQFEKAQQSAMRAERLGFPLDGLKKKLTSTGQWNAARALPDGPNMDCEADAGVPTDADPKKDKP